MRTKRTLQALLLAAAVLVVGCGDDGDGGMGPDPDDGGNGDGGNGNGNGGPTGTLTVTTQSTGTQLDPDGYAFRIDGGAETAIAVNETATLMLAAGEHEVTLTGLEINCEPGTALTRTVTVQEGQTSAVTFPIGCVPQIIDQIVFESVRDNVQNDIYVMDPDGSNVVRLTTFGGCREPAVSPDGRTIAFNRGYELWAMDADGSNARMLRAEGNNPAWSPDGSRIAFNSHSPTSSSRDIYVMDADGTNEVDLTSSFGIQETQPTWSPDGLRIAYRRLDGSIPKSDIYVMDADGSNQTDLLPDAGDESFPAWSPDGMEIAYVSTICRPIDLNPCGDAEIHVAAADGSASRFVSNTLGEDMRPAWSPDGSKLAWDSTDSGDDEIYTADPDGKNRTNITNIHGDDRTYAQSWR